jgi:large subunit ribosomal protein L22
MIDVKANLKYLHIAPRKVRLVAGLLRGKSLKEAKAQMSFSKNKASVPVLKLLKSAEQNARHNFKLETDNLRVKSVRVDEGPVFKRFMPKARGRATTIRRRTSHIAVVLSERPDKVQKAK